MKQIATFALSCSLVVLPTFAFAQTTYARGPISARASSTSTVETPKVEGQFVQMKQQALQAIDARIENLNRLSERLGGLNDSVGNVRIRLNELQGMKRDLGENVGSTTIKARAEAFAKSEHQITHAIRQGTLAAASARVLAVAGHFGVVADKLSARIDTAVTAGADMSVASMALVDMKAKIDSAKISAQVAIDAVKGLVSDEGDKTKMQANLKIFKDARAKVVEAQKALNDARKSAGEIIKALRAYHASTTATTTVEVQTETTTTP